MRFIERRRGEETQAPSMDPKELYSQVKYRSDQPPGLDIIKKTQMMRVSWSRLVMRPAMTASTSSTVRGHVVKFRTPGFLLNF